MARKRTPAVERYYLVEATRLLARSIRSASKLTPAELEERLGIGAEGAATARSGNQWRRYERGVRTLDADARDRLARNALRLGLLPLRVPMFLNELYAWGSLRRLLLDSRFGWLPSESAITSDRKAWSAWHQRRRIRKARERQCLALRAERVRRSVQGFLTFLAGIDGRGHDDWEVELPDRDEVVDALGNVETLSGAAQFLKMLSEVERLVATVRLSVFHGFAADVVPPLDDDAITPA